MRFLRSVCAALLLAAVAIAGDVPTTVLRHSLNTSVTNKDIVILAKAGFDEDFLIRAILGSRCSCDTTATALASLAEEGISQRVIEVMLDASYVEPVQPVVVPSVAAEPALTVANPSRVATIDTGRRVAYEPATPPTIIQQSTYPPSATKMAVSNRIPYYDAQSALWGLWRKKTGVMNAKAPDRSSTTTVLLPVNGMWQHVGIATTEPLLLPRPRVRGRFWYSLGLGGVPGVLADYLVSR